MNKLIITISLIILSHISFNAQGKNIYIIANKGSFAKVDKISDLSQYYMIKRKVTDSGVRIIPINLPLSNSLREAFSFAVFKRSPVGLKEYWDRMSFRGIKPPIVQQSEKAVTTFVSRIPGALGYVSVKPHPSSNIDIIGEISL